MENTRETKEIYAEFIAKQDEKRLIYGVVSEPDTPDAHDDIMTAETIEEAAHFYMLNSQTVGQSHEMEADARIVESYIAPVDFSFGEQEIKKGSWVIVTKVYSDALWEGVKNGDFTGYSVGGYGVRTPIEES